MIFRQIKNQRELLFVPQLASLFFVLFFILAIALPQHAVAVVNTDTTGKGTGITYECKDGNCDWGDLLAATKKALDFGIKFALMFSVVVIAYAGFELMISGDNQSKRTDAKNRLVKVALGIIWILAAWLVVTLILKGLGVDKIVDFS